MENSNTILKEAIIEALGTVYDPEIPVSIWELGLVYNIDIDEKNNILITMTLTTPNCPEAETIPDRVAEAVSKCDNVEDVRVENNASIGPYARLRPGTILAEGAKIGNFVEVKKSKIGKN